MSDAAKMQTVTDYERHLINEVSHKSRQLAEARRLLRLALKYGCANERNDYVGGAMLDVRKAIRNSYPRLDDRRAKRTRKAVRR